MFGGTANLKHLVLVGNDDEQFDTDNNYSGSVQFMIAMQERNNDLLGGDFMFEMSCNKSGGGGIAALCPPPSNSVRRNAYPKISNATLVMDSTQARDGLKLDTGTGLLFWNSVVTPASTATNVRSCMLVQDTTTVTHLQNINASTFGSTSLKAFNSVYFGCATSFTVGSNSGFTAANLADIAPIFTAGANNTALGTSTLTSRFVNGANESGVVATNPTVLNGLDNNNVGFFTSVNYIGAVRDSSDTWYAGWTCGLTGSVC
jgi:hypothetical protein